MFTFSTDNVKDIENYYLGTVVKFKETGDRLWYINNVSSSEVRCLDVDNFELYVDLEEPYEVEYTIPGRVVYQSGKYACLIARVPAKQYKRGISDQNTALFYLSGGSWKKQQIKIAALQQFVDKPAYQNPEWCFKEPYGSWAINRYISVSDDFRVWALTTPVGAIDIANKKVHSSYSLFKPELKKAFPNWEIL